MDKVKEIKSKLDKISVLDEKNPKYLRLRQLIQWIDNQEDKLADPHWFDKHKNPEEAKKRMIEGLKPLLEEYHQIRKELGLEEEAVNL